MPIGFTVSRSSGVKDLLPAISSSIEIGYSGTLTTTVQPGHTIVLGGDPTAEVFSTPSMINLMEHAARKALSPFLGPGEESVGIDVQVKHLAATPPDQEIKAVATITKVEKNIVSFEIQAHDDWEKIGTATHRRAIVQTAKIADKVSSKKSSRSGRSQEPVQGTQKVQNRPSHSDLAALQLDDFRLIGVKQKQHILEVVLNRPEKKNAINQAMTEELAVLVEWLAQHGQEISVVIFSGSGNSFSTGDDVSELHPDEPEKMRDLSLLRGAVYRKLANLPQVTIAAVDGFALGGGFVFVAACDFRIASHNAQFGLPEAKLGWPPNYGIEILRSSLGRPTVIQWSASGDLINAQMAHSAGFLQETVPQTLLLVRANQIAEKVSQNSPFAIAAIKRIMSVEENRSDQNATDEFLDCLKTENAKHALRDFS